MKDTQPGRRSRAARAPAPDRLSRRARIATRLAAAARLASAGVTTLAGRVPGALEASGTGARRAASALQALPDPTLRWLAAGSVGLGAGFFLAGKPRLIIAAGVAPALAIGAAMVAPNDRAPTRPEPVHERTSEMTDEHAKGAISKAQGKLEETLGKLTGNKRQQVKGAARQVKGDAQEGLGDIQDTVRGRTKTR